MGPKKKDALILIDKAGLKPALKFLPWDIGKVAMTVDAMHAFRQNGMDYRVFDDFFDIGSFRQGNTAMMRQAGELLRLLDRQNEKALEYERAFSGNILYFMTFFTNLYYVYNVCQGLRKDYNRLYLAGSSYYDKVFDINMDMSLNGLAFHSFNAGLANKVSMVRSLLMPQCYWHNARDYQGINLPYYLHKASRAARKAGNCVFFLGRRGIKLNFQGCIYIMQAGYETGYIKDRMPGYDYIRPLDDIKSAPGFLKATAFEMGQDSLKAVQEFCDKWFDGFMPDIKRLFDSYCRQVACYIASFFNHAQKRFDADKPSALFFAAGACRISEDIYAYIANKRKIPLYYFQHGGTTMFYKHPYQEYVEQNPVIDKTNMYHSAVELDFFNKGNAGPSYAPGSDRLYDFYHARQNERKRRNKKILYCSSVFNSYNYRDMMTNSAERDLFQINNDIIDCVKSLGLSMSVKAHPSDERFNYGYFRHMVNDKKADRVDVMRRIPAEAVIDRYGLLILDYIGTALVPVSLTLDMPVIIYLKDKSLLRSSSEKDLCSRFYVVSCRQELEDCLTLYKKDALESRFSKGLMEKYAFRIDSPRPSDLIAEIIKNDITIFNKKGFFNENDIRAQKRAV
ncbi:MAG: hypothetical protein PHV77_00245 [Candidatus Omnitrophica bacterium]|nr:hypothetical protein [Candidatus Omnitrophota bacterium]